MMIHDCFLQRGVMKPKFGIKIKPESTRVSNPNSAEVTPEKSGEIGDIIKLLRPHQWTKNLFCLAGVIFGGRLGEINAIANGILMVVLFSMMASAVYIFNDIQDIDRDRQHPKKRFRPLPSGRVKLTTAKAIGIFLITVSLIGSYNLGIPTFSCLLLYGINNVAYSLKLKNIPLFDVNCIAFGFVLRLLAGIYAVGDTPTAWITLCIFFLTLFQGFAKRRSELLSLLHKHNPIESLEELSPDSLNSTEKPSYLQLFYQRGQNNQQRPVLCHYTLPYLDSLLNSTATMTIMCYSLFTISSGKNTSLVITVPIVYYAVMHYKRIVTVLAAGEEPDRILIEDNSIKISLFLWLVSYLAIVYFDLHIFL